MLIVITVRDFAQQHNSVDIMDKDIDLLVVMICHCRSVHSNIYFLKTGKGTVSPIIFLLTENLINQLLTNNIFLCAIWFL